MKCENAPLGFTIDNNTTKPETAHHQEILTTEEIARKHTSQTIYTMLELAIFCSIGQFFYATLQYNYYIMKSYTRYAIYNNKNISRTVVDCSQI